MDSGLRYFGGAVAFGFAAVWIMWSLAAALLCLLAAAVGYGAGLAAEHTRAKLAVRAGSPRISIRRTLSLPRRKPEADDLSRKADELNRDLGHLYQPPTTPPPRTAEDDGSSLRSPTETPQGG